jgi:NAD(P)-dependent dehydrogenase (short-subunit alcohol dehydrogenase family)
MNIPLRVDLTGKTAVVTGGGGVLCSRFAVALAASGAKVALIGRTRAKTEAVADEIKEAGGIALSVQGDVLDQNSMQAARDLIIEELGPCDILINGAGGNSPKGTTSKENFNKADLLDSSLVTFFDLDPQGIENVFNLNFLGTLIPTQIFARDMINRSGAVIINVSSMNALKPLTKIPAYSGAKAAVSNLTQWLAVHFAPVGIRVNAIAPGFFVSDQNHALLFQPDGSPSDRARKILNMTPMGRFGEAEELVGTLLWLVHQPSSGFVNGIVVPVDGGFSAYSGV